MAIPSQHVADSHKLTADGRVELFELTPSGTAGTIFFKADNDYTYRTNEYTGIPVSITGEKKSSDVGLTMPRMIIGQPDIDISLFKPLVYDGYLDNAVIIRRAVLLDDMLNHRPIWELTTYRVKRVEEYGRTKIQMQLATRSDSLGFSMPYRTFVPPAYPSVQM